jgi:ketosteroid isomerase-like protein
MNTFEQFVAAINARNVDHIVDLMTDDHLFIDSQGTKMRGKETMRAGWEGYYALFADYYIRVNEVFENGNTVVALGAAGAGKGKKAWEGPAAWKAVIENGKVKLWQVYADSTIPMKILEAGE